MPENRWNRDDRERDDRRSWTERAGDEVRSWFGDDEAQMRRGNDERSDRYPYGGTRSWRDQRDEPYEERFGSSGWRGAREFGGEEGRRGGWSADQYRDYGRGGGDYGRGYGDYGRDRDTERYGRGGQYGSTSYDRGQLRRTQSDWTPGAGAGARDWDSREPSGWSGESRGASWYGSSEMSHRRESYAGRGPKGYRRSDDRIREEVSDTLTADPQVDASEIEVRVENGVVTLTGTVASRDQKRRAEDCAEGVSGVEDVTNNLRVNRNDNRPEHQDVSRMVTPSVVSGGGTDRTR